MRFWIGNAADWLALNAYAILLDAVASAAAISALCLIRERRPAAAVLAVAAAAFAAYGAAELHGSYPYKRQLFRILVRKNRTGLRPETFEGRFDAPCHRLLVRRVLQRTGWSHAYRELFRRYYVPPWKRFRRNKGTYIIFKTPEEGKSWLSRQNNQTF